MNKKLSGKLAIIYHPDGVIKVSTVDLSDGSLNPEYRVVDDIEFFAGAIAVKYRDLDIAVETEIYGNTPFLYNEWISQ